MPNKFIGGKKDMEIRRDTSIHVDVKDRFYYRTSSVRDKVLRLRIHLHSAEHQNLHSR